MQILLVLTLFVIVALLILLVFQAKSLHQSVATSIQRDIRDFRAWADRNLPKKG